MYRRYPARTSRPGRARRPTLELKRGGSRRKAHESGRLGSGQRRRVQLQAAAASSNRRRRRACTSGGTALALAIARAGDHHRREGRLLGDDERRQSMLRLLAVERLVHLSVRQTSRPRQPSQIAHLALHELRRGRRRIRCSRRTGCFRRGRGGSPVGQQRAVRVVHELDCHCCSWLGRTIACVRRGAHAARPSRARCAHRRPALLTMPKRPSLGMPAVGGAGSRGPRRLSRARRWCVRSRHASTHRPEGCSGASRADAHRRLRLRRWPVGQSARAQQRAARRRGSRQRDRRNSVGCVRPVAQTCAHARKRLPVCGGTALACRRAGPAPYARLRLAARPLREFLALGLPLSIFDCSLQCSTVHHARFGAARPVRPAAPQSAESAPQSAESQIKTKRVLVPWRLLLAVVRTPTATWYTTPCDKTRMVLRSPPRWGV